MAIGSVSAASDYSVLGQSLSSQMSAAEVSKINETVTQANKNNLIGDRVIKQTMDKNDFLTLLVTQLQNQDPSAPMEDKQFIAQMAQFSSLEQMNNMAAEFQKVSALLQGNSALGVLGKFVDIADGDSLVSGVVDQVTNGANPQVLINGQYYDYSAIARVKNN